MVQTGRGKEKNGTMQCENESTRETLGVRSALDSIYRRKKSRYFVKRKNYLDGKFSGMSTLKQYEWEERQVI